MLDRESTFAQPGIVELLKTRFIPVAIDQACQRRQKDAEGVLYRKIAGQGPRSNFQATTQGFYIATASGQLLLYNNNRDPQKLLRLMKERLREYELGAYPYDKAKLKAEVDSEAGYEIDPRYTLRPPENGLVVRVHARILGGYEPAKTRSRELFQQAISRDNLWLTASEHATLAQGRVPTSLQQRLARFHLVDNTRGEPPMWKKHEIRELVLNHKEGLLKGHVRLETDDGKRGYQARLRGRMGSEGGRITRFELVALGEFFGEGTYTRNAPEGRFPLAVTFQLADGTDIADQVAPQGARGWVDGYLK